MQENEIQIRVNQEIEKFLSNPINIIQAYDKALKAATQEIQEMKPRPIKTLFALKEVTK